jgi:hypothetical protein
VLQLLICCVSLFPGANTAAQAASTAHRADEKLDRLLERFCAGDNAAFNELVELGEPAVAGLLALLADVERNVVTRFMAANVLGDIGSERSVLPMIAALADEQYNVAAASRRAGKMRRRRARKPLLELAEKDPFVYRDPKSGEDLYLVREDARHALAILDGLDPGAGNLKKEPEILLEDASRLPPSPVRVEVKRLPSPFAGEFEKQNLFNNYQQPTDGYVHGGLDIMNPAGTQVRAVDSGWVAFVSTNYPDWTTHHFFVVAAEKGGRAGLVLRTSIRRTSASGRRSHRTRRGARSWSTSGQRQQARITCLNYVQFAKKTDGTYDTNPLVVAPVLRARGPRRAAIDPARFVMPASSGSSSGSRACPCCQAVDVIAGIGDVPQRYRLQLDGGSGDAGNSRREVSTVAQAGARPARRIGDPTAAERCT